jgi:biotin carboxyl carrier protein
MNEIISEVDGEVVDICVKNSQVVEYSQILFKIF